MIFGNFASQIVWPMPTKMEVCQMRICTSIALVLFGLTVCPAIKASEDWSDEAELVKQLNELNTRLTQAYENEDIETLKQLLAKDHVHNNVFGFQMDKATFLKDIESGILEFVSYETPEIKWTITEPMAVATGLIKASAIRDGKPVPATDFRFTRIFVKRAGKWKVLLFHNTMAGKRPPAAKD